MSLTRVATARRPFATVRRFAAGLAVCCAVAGLLPSPAMARVFVGFGYAPYWGPPAYYPPPVYYAPPPVVYAPPPPVYSPEPRAAYQQTCYAGPYSCPMDHPTTPGAACYCAGNGGQRVWGRSN